MESLTSGTSIGDSGTSSRDRGASILCRGMTLLGRRTSYWKSKTAFLDPGTSSMGSETVFLETPDDNSVGNGGARDARDAVPELTDDVQEL
jgi:hypothetical protein